MCPRPDVLDQLDQHLACPSQNWLLGAGISWGAGIPLMAPLTARVLTLLEGTPSKEVLDALMSELPSDSHVEHLLSHLGDYIALAERSKSQTAAIGGTQRTKLDLVAIHDEITTLIATIIRCGYKPETKSEPESIGSIEKPITNLRGHLAFVRGLFISRAGLEERRVPINLFTTNYDTLLEDALALSCIHYWDGFIGGAVAFRSHRFGQDAASDGARAHVIKLHGSVDWRTGDDGRVWRVRDLDTYPEDSKRVLIYPQSTKYVATQRDPFAAQFDLFRRAIASPTDNVLAVCGYSFGDDHINQEIEYGMTRPQSKTTLIAFIPDATKLPICLNQWRSSAFADRIYFVTQQGVFVGSDQEQSEPIPDWKTDSWTFEGASRILVDGTRR